MAHWSETNKRLKPVTIRITSISQIETASDRRPATFLFSLPFPRTQQDAKQSTTYFQSLAEICSKLNEQSTICFLTTPEDAALLLAPMIKVLKFQHWVAIKTTSDAYDNRNGELTRRHASLLIFTRYDGPLAHTTTRIEYSYCPACHKTTKDYGGKAHMYHEFGTSISDVWRDVEWNPAQGMEVVSDRLRDLFGLKPYRELRVIRMDDSLNFERQQNARGVEGLNGVAAAGTVHPKRLRSRLVHGDCLETLRSIPSNSIDFCFADLPYNLKKKYCRSSDDLEIVDYFRWCDDWLAELYRVLRPGGTLAVLNIPVLSARHFEYLSAVMNFRNWIVWDALSLPFRKIMPAHYAILCFSKGEAGPLPGLIAPAIAEEGYLIPNKEGLCIRPGCRSKRPAPTHEERDALTDIWHDVHRLKHNTRRVNHPCQLPPLLMRRLFSLFTLKGDIILDCFNASGTSTLVASQMGRRYIGIERSKRYHNLAGKRHEQLRHGHDPFNKGKEIPKTKNNRVRRIPPQKYAVTKKALQLDVKRIYEELGRLPTRDDVARHSLHPIKYFKEYFANWGEVCAAARTTGIPPSQ